MPAVLPVMRDRHASISDFPAHANVMALIKAFGEPVPWALLLEVVAQLQHTASETALGSLPAARVESTLLDVVTDLRALGLVSLGPTGTVFTDAGEDVIREWNGQFTARLDAARQALKALGILG